MRYPLRGITLIELIVVVVMVSLLSITTMISLNANRQHSVMVQSNELRRAISHVQLLAISQGVRVRLTATATGYSAAICTATDCSTTSALTDPATGAAFAANSASENITLAGGPLMFDSMGRPLLANGTGINSSSTTFTFTGGGNTVTVTVLPITGFVQTS